MEIKIIPITNWQGKKNGSPRPSQFKATYTNTLKMLKSELEKANCYGDPQIQMFIHSDDLRKDGNLRANANPYQPGVKLVFRRLGERFFNQKEQKWQYKIKTVSYPCDAFDNWQDNLRGIALSMAAFRQIERYGVFKYDDIMERLALPEIQTVSSAEKAAVFIAQFSIHTSDEILSNKEVLKDAYFGAAKQLHPDKKDGDEDEFKTLQDAYGILKEYFGL